MSSPTHKQCSKCGDIKPRKAFNKDGGSKDGLYSQCAECRNKARRERDKAAKAPQPPKPDPKVKEAQERLGSDYAALRPEDFDVSVGNDGRIDPKAAQEKRQEYSRAMGEFGDALHTSDDPRDIPSELGTYIGRLAEQERRFGNRRLARSVSLQAAHESLALRQFKQAAREYLRDKIQPAGYALKPKSYREEQPRSVVLLLSDLHLGAELSERDNPIPFGAVQEARRLEKVVRETLDFKPQYRDRSELLLLLNGDLIEGLLGHDLRDGAPLTEQKVIFWRYFRVILGLFSSAFPRVRVVCQPGNHGRDKVRHPGRATSSKWDGHEWQLYWALSEMCSALLNVSWDIPFRAASTIDLQGHRLLMTHGDTEIKLGDPDTQAARNAMILDRVNASRVYGERFDAAAFGHFHKPRYRPGVPSIVFNGALLPPNGYARSEGYLGEPCGQWLWEAVPGFPVGDLRFLSVDASTDRDETLGRLIEPFRFSQGGVA